jgi:hypothetical protein
MQPRSCRRGRSGRCLRHVKWGRPAGPFPFHFLALPPPEHILLDRNGHTGSDFHWSQHSSFSMTLSLSLFSLHSKTPTTLEPKLDGY